MMNLSAQQQAAASLLNRALERATSSGLLDELAGFTHPDHINQVCDAMAKLNDAAGLDKQPAAHDQVSVEHWDSPRYGGGAQDQMGMSFTFEVVDMRTGAGSLLVNIGDDNGEIDDRLSAAFEITTHPGSTAASPAMMIYSDDEVVARLFRQPNGHLIVPLRAETQIVSARLANGNAAWVLLDH